MGHWLGHGFREPVEAGSIPAFRLATLRPTDAELGLRSPADRFDSCTENFTDTPTEGLRRWVYETRLRRFDSFSGYSRRVQFRADSGSGPVEPGGAPRRIF